MAINNKRKHIDRRVTIKKTVISIIILIILIFSFSCNRRQEIPIAFIGTGEYNPQEEGSHSSAEITYRGIMACLKEKESHDPLKDSRLKVIKFNDQGDDQTAIAIACAITLGYGPELFPSPAPMEKTDISNYLKERGIQLSKTAKEIDFNALLEKEKEIVQLKTNIREKLQLAITVTGEMKNSLESKLQFVEKEKVSLFVRTLTEKFPEAGFPAPELMEGIKLLEKHQDQQVREVAALMKSTREGDIAILLGLYYHYMLIRLIRSEDPLPGVPVGSYTQEEQQAIYTDYLAEKEKYKTRLLGYEYELQVNLIRLWEELSRDHLLPEALNQFMNKERFTYYGVIGHSYSKCSAVAAPIYNKAAIPMISPHSTSKGITEERPYIFRTIFNNNLQASFLANYAAETLNLKEVIIVYEEGDTYCDTLKEKFAQVWESLGNTVVKVINLKEYSSIKNLSLDPGDFSEKTALFLALHNQEGAEVLEEFRKRRLETIASQGFPGEKRALTTILTPDSFLSEYFQSALKGLMEQENKQGYNKYYEDQIYVAAPLLFDTAGEEAQAFQANFEKENHFPPDWTAAYGHDTMLLFYQGLKTLKTIKNQSPREVRKGLQKFLASQRSPEEQNRGITGYNFFDSQGNAMKPVGLGVYNLWKPVAAMHQFQTIKDLSLFSDYIALKKEGKIITLDLSDDSRENRLELLKIDVVYTGTEFNSIREINFLNGTAVLDFDIWFRYSRSFEKNLDFKEIHFANAVEDIVLGDPPGEPGEDTIAPINVREDSSPYKYRRYHIQSKFKNNFLLKDYKLNHQVLGFNFSINKHPRQDMRLVTDSLGIGLGNEDFHLTAQKKERKILNSSTGWFITEIYQYEDTEKRITHGDPLYMEASEGAVDFSRYNVAVYIGQTGENIKKMLFGKAGVLHLLLVLLLFSSLLILDYKTEKQQFFLFLLETMSLISLMAIGEQVIGKTLLSSLQLSSPEIINVIFDMLWWFLYATLVIIILEKFIWHPLERKSGRKVPKFAKVIFAALIIIIALICIIAFVFKQQLTSLIATSGAIAIIIGILSKMNLSDVIGGFTLNLDATFGIGDCISVGNVVGEVVDIRWRCTRIRTEDLSIISFPNHKLATAEIKNFNHPDPRYATEIALTLESKFPPERITKLLCDAALAIESIENSPPPQVRVREITPGGTMYVLEYRIKNFKLHKEVKANLWNRLRQVLNFTAITPILPELAGKEQSPEEVLEKSETFIILKKAEKERLADMMKKRIYNPGELILQEGENTNSLILISEGVISIGVLVPEMGTRMEVARLGAGEILGETAFMKDAPRNASAVALTATIAYEIDRDDVRPLLKKEPEFIQQLSRLIHKREQEQALERQRFLSANRQKTGFWKKLLERIKKRLQKG